MEDSPPPPPQSGLPSPPASPASSSLSLPTNMSLSEFMSDIEWSRAPSPFVPQYQLYAGAYNHENGNGELTMRIPELSLGDPYQSEDGAGVFGGTGANGPAHPELRLLLIDKNCDSFHVGVDSEKSSERRFADVFRENGEDGDWEEWEDELESLPGDHSSIKSDTNVQLEDTGKEFVSDSESKVKVKVMWNHRKSTLLYVLPPSRDWSTPAENLKLRRLLIHPFTRLKPLFSSVGLDDPTAELRRMLSIPKLGLWTAIVFGMDSPPTESQKILLMELSHFAPTIPIPPPTNSRSTSHSHTHSPLPYQHQPPRHHKHHKIKHYKRCIPSFRPSSLAALVQGLMGSNASSIREGLREDSAEGFLRWCRSSHSPSGTEPELYSGLRKRKQAFGALSRSRGRSDTFCTHTHGALSSEFTQFQQPGTPHSSSCESIVGPVYYDPLNLKSFLQLGLSICVGLLNTKLRLPLLYLAKAGVPTLQGGKEMAFVVGVGLGIGVGVGLGVAMTLATTSSD